MYVCMCMRACVCVVIAGILHVIFYYNVILFHYLTLMIYFCFMKNSHKFQNTPDMSLQHRTDIPDVPKN